MRGDLLNLAAEQARIVHWIAERTAASRIIVCPSYHTDDLILDRVFGQRPDNYLEDLVRRSIRRSRCSGRARRCAPASSAPGTWSASADNCGASPSSGTTIPSTTDR